MVRTPKLALVGHCRFHLRHRHACLLGSRLIVGRSPRRNGASRSGFHDRGCRSSVVVHAHTQRTLLNLIPDQVRFKVQRPIPTRLS